MRDFLIFARRLVRDRAMLVAALFFAMLSAVGMGVGVVSMVPVIKLIVNEENLEGAEDLPGYAVRFNDGGRELLGIPVRIPQWIIDVVPEGRFAGIVFVISVIALLTVVGATFNFIHQYLSITVAARTIANARLQLFQTAMYMPLLRVVTRGPSEFISRIVRDTAALQRGLISLMSKAVAQSTQAIVLFGVAVLAGRLLTIAALVVLPLLAILLRKLGKRIRRATRGALRRQEDLLRLATENIQGLRAVKANTAEERAIQRFNVVNREVVRQELRARLARALASPVVETIAVFAVGGLVVFAGRNIVSGSLTIERFVIALGALGVAGSKLKVLAGLVNELQAASAPARRILDILDEPSEENRTRPSNVLPRHGRTIRFEGVRLTYPGSADAALQSVDLEIPHGARVAIVGPNGCGKTTLVSLVPRLLVPDAGRILIDGTDVATVSLASLRGQMSVVTQETVMFRGSIAENIAFGSSDATRDAIVQAARRAHADGFIERIPGGFDANVAEQGSSLSGGQRQRIAIARTILRDPSILILDEATSQIDAESEAQITAAIAEFAHGRTVLVIAHRLATVLDADRIIVMDHGTIVDQGRHDELLGRCELYRRLSQTQLIATAG